MWADFQEAVMAIVDHGVDGRAEQHRVADIVPPVLLVEGQALDTRAGHRAVKRDFRRAVSQVFQ